MHSASNRQRSLLDILYTPWGYSFVVVLSGGLWWAFLRGPLGVPLGLALGGTAIPIGILTWIVTPRESHAGTTSARLG